MNGTLSQHFFWSLVTKLSSDPMVSLESCWAASMNLLRKSGRLPADFVSSPLSLVLESRSTRGYVGGLLFGKMWGADAKVCAGIAAFGAGCGNEDCPLSRNNKGRSKTRKLECGLSGIRDTAIITLSGG